MDEHKENIRAKDVNVKMSNPKENEKVSVGSELASYYDRNSIIHIKWNRFRSDYVLNTLLTVMINTFTFETKYITLNLALKLHTQKQLKNAAILENAAILYNVIIYTVVVMFTCWIMIDFYWQIKQWLQNNECKGLI